MKITGMLQRMKFVVFLRERKQGAGHSEQVLVLQSHPLHV